MLPAVWTSSTGTSAEGASLPGGANRSGEPRAYRGIEERSPRPGSAETTVVLLDDVSTVEATCEAAIEYLDRGNRVIVVYALQTDRDRSDRASDARRRSAEAALETAAARLSATVPLETCVLSGEDPMRTAFEYVDRVGATTVLYVPTDPYRTVDVLTAARKRTGTLDELVLPTADPEP